MITLPLLNPKESLIRRSSMQVNYNLRNCKLIYLALPKPRREFLKRALNTVG
jgi:hypothetical protein